MLSSGLGRVGGRGASAANARPAFRVCYLCGQQFGSASIGIHIPQCYQKKAAQWERADPATRGNKPKHPDTVNWKGKAGATADEVNDDQFREFEANLVPCPNCARTFLPDRLPVHLRGCKGPKNGASARSPSTAAPSKMARPSQSSPSEGNAKSPADTYGGSSTATSNARAGASSAANTRGVSASSRRGRSSSAKRSGGGGDSTFRPVLPRCYLCGQQFGTASIAIHVPQCYAKKYAQWEHGDPATRGKPPKHPDTVNWAGEGQTAEAQSDAQFQEFVSNLEPCPNCGRRFLSDRLVVHLRSCRPGNSAKPVPTRATTSSGNRPADGTENAARPSSSTPGAPQRPAVPPTKRPNGGASRGEAGGTSAGAKGSGGAANSEEDSLQATSGSAAGTAGDDLNRVHPKKNRLSKNPPVPTSAVTCPQCQMVEYDAAAKYCRECGRNLRGQTLAEPCSTCGESIPAGSRFCATCGHPVNGAAGSERVPGDSNVNAPTVRVVACPACEAVCDADGNFCDNCGAALGEAEPTASTLHALRQPPTRYMFCTECTQRISDLTAVFCEDCGGKLELKTEEGSNGGQTQPPPIASSSSASPQTTAKSASAVKEPASPPPIQRRPKAPPSSSPSEPAGSSSHQPSPSRVTPSAAIVGDEGGAAAVDVEREPCPHCGRRFAPDVLQRHSAVCGGQKKRAVFNMTQQRVADLVEGGAPLPPPSKLSKAGAAPQRSGGKAAASTGGAAPTKPKGKDWRAESEAFRRAMREARQVDQVLKTGGDLRALPPPTYSANPDYVPCPHCQRRFAPDVAERHIPRCATTVNRPKPPPQRRALNK